jgi:ATP-dependent Lon protease
MGGSVLYIEAVQMAGKGEVMTTGSLGDVIKESCHTALSYIRSNPIQTQVVNPRLDQTDIHVHFPDGATKKDGPSAGVAITVALVSLLTDRIVRSDTAMTGEVSLSGIVLPVGGIKEKVLAAHRNNIRRVYLPKSNLKDLHEIPESVAKDMEFIGVRAVEEVLEGVFDSGSKSNILHSKL